MVLMMHFHAAHISQNRGLRINVKFLKPIMPENLTYDSIKDIVQSKVAEQLKKK